MASRVAIAILGLATLLGIVSRSFGKIRLDEPPRQGAGLKVGQESPPPGEAEAIERLKQIQVGIIANEPTLKGERGQHPKQHGCVLADFVVRDDVPADLRYGVFAAPRTYRAVVRFSNGGSFDDTKPDVHGMAIKLVGVKGRKAAGNGEDGETQDFILMDHPVFFSGNVADLVTMSMAIGAAKQGVDEPMERFAAEHPNEIRILGEARSKRPMSPLEIGYWSTVPYQLGQGAVKYLVKPRDKVISERPAAKSENHLRAAMVERLAATERPVIFDFFVQRQTDPISEPIENPTVRWTTPEEPVATIVIAPQEFDTEAQQEFGANLTFDPWHALQDHRPLGGINRARRVIYPVSSRLRHEPTAADLERFRTTKPAGR